MTVASAYFGSPPNAWLHAIIFAFSRIQSDLSKSGCARGAKKSVTRYRKRHSGIGQTALISIW